jgi:hypothetical protein
MRKSRGSREGSFYLDFADPPIVLCVTMHNERRLEMWLERSRGRGKERIDDAEKERERRKDCEGKRMRYVEGDREKGAKRVRKVEMGGIEMW